MRAIIVILLLIMALPGYVSATTECSSCNQSATLWLEADSGAYFDVGTTPATNGQTVEQWNDQSTSGLNASQSTLGSRPVYSTNIINGKPALVFNGSAPDYLIAGGNGDFAAQAMTVFMVFARTGIGQFQVAVSKGSSSAAVWSVTATADQTANVPALVSFNTLTSAGTNKVAAYGGSFNWELMDGQVVDTTHTYIFKNGVQIGTSSDNGNNLNVGSTALGVGASVDGLLPYTGYVAAVIYYPSALALNDRQAVENYLIAKYGITTNWPSAVLHSGANQLSMPIWYHFDRTTTVTPTVNIFTSTDGGVSYSTPSGVSNPVFTLAGPGGQGSSLNQFGGATSDALMYYNGWYWMLTGSNPENCGGPNYMTTAIYRAQSLSSAWSWYEDVPPPPAYSGPATSTWVTRWFVADDGSVHFLSSSGGCVGSNVAISMTPFVYDALNPELTKWKITPLTGTSLRASIIDEEMLTPSHSPNGLFNVWYKDQNTSLIELMSSSSMYSGYTITKGGDWAGWGAGLEGPVVVNIGGTWRMFADMDYPSTTFPNNYGLAYADNLDTAWTKWSGLVNVGSSTGLGGIPGHTFPQLTIPLGFVP